MEKFYEIAEQAHTIQVEISHLKMDLFDRKRQLISALLDSNRIDLIEVNIEKVLREKLRK